MPESESREPDQLDQLVTYRLAKRTLISLGEAIIVDRDPDAALELCYNLEAKLTNWREAENGGGPE